MSDGPPLPLLVSESPRKALHSSKSAEWYTPRAIVDAARDVMGGVIDLDPASCAEANLVVKARRYFTQEQDGLRQAWEAGTCWINPPYGKGKKNKSNQGIWTAKLIDCYRKRHVGEACALVNAVTGNRWFKPLWQFAICFVDGRIHFESPTEDEAESPTHSSCIVHLGLNHKAFAERFSAFGHVVLPEQVVVAEPQPRLL